jgi:hypothetical protein
VEQEARESNFGAVVVVKPEQLVKGEPDRVIAVRHLPLLTLHRAVVSFHTGKHAPLHFTNAYTTAHGHQGEDELPLSSMDAPAFEPRGNAVVRHRDVVLAASDAGLRARLGFFFLQVSLSSLFVPSRSHAPPHARALPGRPRQSLWLLFSLCQAPRRPACRVVVAFATRDAECMREQEKKVMSLGLSVSHHCRRSRIHCTSTPAARALSSFNRHER